MANVTAYRQEGVALPDIELDLDWREACYVLACLGASNNTLFDVDSGLDIVGEDGSRQSLFSALHDALEIQKGGVRDAHATPQTRLYRQISDVLDAWHGRRNYAAARRVAEEVGL